MATTGTVIASSLNLRSSPGGNVIEPLLKGAKIEILEDRGDWLKVAANGQQGFVSAKFVQLEGAPVATPSPQVPTPITTGSFRFEGTNAMAPDGTRFAKKFKLGVFNNGKTSIGDFVAARPERFTAVSPSLLRVMKAVSENEGKLEAINTWDNAFLTFGIFQWTVGTGAGGGELASLIDRLRKTDPAVFLDFFGRHGLDVDISPSPPGSTPLGFFTLNGATLKGASQKGLLRSLEWAYRFWLAGQDDTVRQVQIEHAMGRVDLFYRDGAHKIGTRFVGDYVTSEFGVALLLDQHVNRPGHVPATLAKAVTEMSGGDPATWDDADEKRLLDIYLKLRAKTNMTDSNKRAATIRNAVTAGLASDKRGTFQA